MMIRLLGLSVWVVVVFGFVACSSTEDDSLFEPDPTELLIPTTDLAEIKPGDPTRIVAAQQESGDEIRTWENIAAGVGRLPDFRREMLLRFEAGPDDSTFGSWRMESDFVVSENYASRVLEIDYEGSSAGSEFQSMTVAEKEGHFYLHLPAVGCISISEADFERMNSGIVDPDYFLGGIVDATLIDSGEIVNGQPAHHFTLDKQSLPRFANPDVSVNGHFYISEIDGQPLRVSLEASGVADFAATGQNQDGTLYLEINWYDASDPAELPLPPDCLQSAIYPLPEGIYDITALDDLVGFHTLLSINDVVAFYQAELAAAGWTAAEEPTVLDDSAFMTFSRNGLEIIINIEAGPAIGEVSVLISP